MQQFAQSAKSWLLESHANELLQDLRVCDVNVGNADIGFLLVLGPDAEAQAIVRQLERLDQLIQKRLIDALRNAGWEADVRRCRAIEGVGLITAAALTNAFHRGAFTCSDAFIAYLGLDVRVRDSGSYRGRRKLTKQGDPEPRRLLYLAAMKACKSDSWRSFYLRYLDRGFTKIQALVILARKLARIAFAVMKTQTDYLPRAKEAA